MDQNIQNMPPQSIDIKYYLDVVISRLNIFVICALTIVILGVTYTVTKKPVFRATAQVEVNAGVRMPINENVYKDRGGNESHFYINKQMQILTGDTLKDRVLKLLKPEWQAKLSKRVFEDPGIKAQSTKGNLVEIWVDSPNRDYALAYLTVLTGEFTKLKAELQEKSSGFALYNLTKQADELSKKISDIQNKMQDFRTENSSLLLEKKGGFLSTYLLKLNNKLSDLKTERVLIEKQIKALEENKNPLLWISVIDDIQRGSVTPAISKETQPQSQLISQGTNGGPNQNASASNKNTPTNISIEPLPFVFVLEKEKNARWEGLRNRYEKLKSELARISTIMKPEHPKRVQLEKELGVITSQMEAEVRSLLEKFKARREAVALEEQVLQEEIKQYQQTTLSSLKQVSQFSVLEDEEARLKKLYDLLIQRIEEVRVSSDFGQETVLLVEEPRVKPLPPKIFRNLLLSLLFGFGFGIAAVFALDYLDDSIKTGDDLKKYIELPALGLVNSISWEKSNASSRKLTDIKDEHATESYRTLRTNILLSRPSADLRTILITSALPGEGKTTTAANTAIILAQGGLKVLLIDADLRKPAVHKIFGLKNGKGLSSIILGSERLDDCVRQTGIDKLDLITAGPITPDPTRLFHLPAMKEILNYACTKYDKIVVDSAPVLTVVDSVVVSDFVDGIICVVHGGKTSRMALIKAKEALLDNTSKLLGVVINNLAFSRVRHQYYYGYKYGYSYGYKYGYGSDKKRRLSIDTKKEAEREVQETVV